jgi:LysR family glycine cleavage system transcriptional activator
MDWTKLPSLNSLRAFILVAESGSYSRAAQRLNVTHAAVNQQVKLLEQHLGIPLVIRQGRGIALTDLGQLLARELADGFETIGTAVQTIFEEEKQRPVQVSMSPAFAVEWLMPRLNDFQLRYPDIVLMLNPTADVEELRVGGIDLAIRYADQTRLAPGTSVLLRSDTVVVGTPEVMELLPSDNPAALQNVAWLEELGTTEVSQWFARHNVTVARLPTIYQMPGNLIMQAVRRGDGITYSLKIYFEDELRAGTMRALHVEPHFGAMYLESAPGHTRSQVSTFIHWLQQQAKQTHP